MNDSLSLRNRLNVTVRDIPRSGIRDFFDLVTTMKDVISLGIGEPDFDTPWHVRESTVFALERGATHYTSNFGYIDLRRAISRYVRQMFGAEYNPDNEVLVTVGVSEALDLALRAILNPGDEVLYHERAALQPHCVLRLLTRSDIVNKSHHFLFITAILNARFDINNTPILAAMLGLKTVFAKRHDLLHVLNYLVGRFIHLQVTNTHGQQFLHTIANHLGIGVVDIQNAPLHIHLPIPVHGRPKKSCK